MSTQNFNLPDVGEGLTEAEIVTWKVAPGDTVAINDVICEIETAKSLVELPSPHAGVVGELLAAEGATVEVGSPIITRLMTSPPFCSTMWVRRGHGTDGASRMSPWCAASMEAASRDATGIAPTLGSQSESLASSSCPPLTIIASCPMGREGSRQIA